MTLDELITYALQKDAEKVCTPEIMDELWRRVHDALAQEETE